VLKYDGTTGAFLGAFVGPGSDLSLPRGLTFGPDGNLYVANRVASETSMMRLPLLFAVGLTIATILRCARTGSCDRDFGLLLGANALNRMQ
jgi:hypothetical protein